MARMTAYAVCPEGVLLRLDAIWAPVHPADPDRVDLIRRGEAFPLARADDGLPGLFRVHDGTHRAAASVLAGFSHVPTCMWA